MLKLIGAVVVVAAVVVAANRWWNRGEKKTVEVLTGQGNGDR